MRDGGEKHQLRLEPSGKVERQSAVEDGNISVPLGTGGAVLSICRAYGCSRWKFSCASVCLVKGLEFVGNADVYCCTDVYRGESFQRSV